ncbi:MAG: hypothetical protein JSW34_08395 [Candidatus Zixiibacteriota bacterium]|nr:MAG: hypothetical protein JSW34_08395 [candidate division Zixibacteria bacterium]
MKQKGSMILGFTLVLVGLLLVGQTTDLFDLEDLVSAVLPIFFIGLGFWLLIRRKRKPDRWQPPAPPKVGYETAAERGPETRPAGPPESGAPSDRVYEQPRISQSPECCATGKLKYKKTLGDMYVDLNGMSLADVEIAAGVGDLEIKLHGATLDEGLNRMIISSFIGDIRIYAPPDMAVFIHCSSSVGDIDVMGRRSSGFGNTVDSQTANYESSSDKLYIACNNFIGDIRIYGL